MAQTLPPRSGASNFNDQFLTESIPVGWPWRLLVFAAFIFALSIFTYFGLRLGYRNYLDDQLEQLDRDLGVLEKQVSLEEQEKFTNFYSKLVNLEKVLVKHPFGSNIFTFLERNVVNGVHFNAAEADISGGTMELKGVANDFNALAQQTAIFEQSPEIKLVLMKDIGLTPGSSGVTFTLTMGFKEEFFSKPI